MISSLGNTKWRVYLKHIYSQNGLSWTFLGPYCRGWDRQKDRSLRRYPKTVRDWDPTSAGKARKHGCISFLSVVGLLRQQFILLSDLTFGPEPLLLLGYFCLLTLPPPLTRQESMFYFSSFLTRIPGDHSARSCGIMLALIHLIPLSCKAEIKFKYIWLYFKVLQVRHKMYSESEVGSYIHIFLRQKRIRLRKSIEGRIGNSLALHLIHCGSR